MTQEMWQSHLETAVSNGSLQPLHIAQTFSIYEILQTACVGVLHDDSDAPIGWLLTRAEADVIIGASCEEALALLREREEASVVLDAPTLRLCVDARGQKTLLRRLARAGFSRPTDEEECLGEVNGLQPYMAVLFMQNLRDLKREHRQRYGRYRKVMHATLWSAVASAVLSLLCVCTAGLRETATFAAFNPWIDAGFLVFLVVALALWGITVVCAFKADYDKGVAQMLGEAPMARRLLNNLLPIRIEGQTIAVNSDAFFLWMECGAQEDAQYIVSQAMPLSEKEPTLLLREDGIKTREYVLQTKGNEDFSGQYFLICVRLGIIGKPPVPVIQIDGYISETPDERPIDVDDVAYRMEGHFLACGEEISEKYYEKTRGQDLTAKGLAFPGYTTPANVRLIGICPSCGKSFAFHSYAFHAVKSDVAYSDDGLDCCEFRLREIDKESWSCAIGDKTFRYYNSFCCPHCGEAYIDYKAHPETKVFGVSGCVHIGHTAFCETEATNA